jgi:two-component system cell cycle response regulator
MATTITVGLMGFSPSEQIRLKQLFMLSQDYERFYQLTELTGSDPVEILLVKQGDEFVPQQQQSYLARYTDTPIQVVRVGRKPITDLPAFPFIQGVLVPSRVFAVLDTLPVKVAPLDLNTGMTEPAAEEALQVLVVDDSSMMQKTIHLELQKASVPLVVDFAESGEIALEKVQQKQYDIIFLDTMMPGVDGFETCAQIRQREGFSKTPIILLTDKTSAFDEVKGLMAGCTTCLSKPFTHDDLHKMVERIVHWLKRMSL